MAKPTSKLDIMNIMADAADKKSKKPPMPKDKKPPPKVVK